MNYAQMTFKALEHLIEIKFPLIIALMLHLAYLKSWCVVQIPSSVVRQFYAFFLKTMQPIFTKSDIQYLQSKEIGNIVNFMTPTGMGDNLWVKSVKYIYLLKIVFSTSKYYIRQTDIYTRSNDEQGKVYQNCRFHDPTVQGLLCQGVVILLM